MNFLKGLEPKSYDDILGNKKVVNILKASRQYNKSIILFGVSGIGKSCIGRVYLETPITECSGTSVTVAELRQLRGNVLLNELDALNKSQQKVLINLLDNEQIILVATSVAYKTSIIEELRTRCLCLNVEYPDLDSCKGYIESVLKLVHKTYTEDTIKQIHGSCTNLRGLGNILHYILTVKCELTQEEIHKALEVVGGQDNSMEEVKSALQKSIRGSDVDAACMYACNLMKNGYLEQLCRRLLIIASEDIGLASNQALLLTKSCIDIALQVGMPEAKFPVLHAVMYLALQPKSNSVHEVWNKCEELPDVLKVPDNIKYVHSYSYLYPHDYPNHWVKQNYAPIGFENVKVYKPQNNKNEKAYAEYWKKVKGNNE